MSASSDFETGAKLAATVYATAQEAGVQWIICLGGLGGLPPAAGSPWACEPADGAFHFARE